MREAFETNRVIKDIIPFTLGMDACQVRRSADGTSQKFPRKPMNTVTVVRAAAILFNLADSLRASIVGNTKSSFLVGRDTPSSG